MAGPKKVATIIEDLASSSGSKGAALVGFKSSATGSVARTANAKLDETFSLKDAGAVGDGGVIYRRSKSGLGWHELGDHQLQYQVVRSKHD